jgi:glycosyltransferase involved in cell wall biosynthesis
MEVHRALAQTVPSCAGAERVRILTWGVDTEHFSPTDKAGRDKARAAFGLPADATVLLSNRILDPYYRIIDIIKAFVVNVRSDGTYLLVHSLPGRADEYRRACGEAAGGDRRVVFTDRSFSYEELPMLYHAADLALHYPRTDSAPLSLFEALSCGVGVVCADDVPSYADFARVWHLERRPIGAMSDATVAQELDAARKRGSENRELVIRKRSEDLLFAELLGLYGIAPEASRG